MSSPYAILDNRPIDQWKVTELKEELKRRKLMTKGLKEDLVKRLDEAVRAEIEEAKMNVDSVSEPDVQSENVTTSQILTEGTTELKDSGDDGYEIVDYDDIKDKIDIENSNDELLKKDADVVPVDDGMGSLPKETALGGEFIGGTNSKDNVDAENSESRLVKMDADGVQVDDGLGSLAKEAVPEVEFVGGTDSTSSEGLQGLQSVPSQTDALASDNLVSETAYKSPELRDSDTQKENEDSKPKPDEGASGMGNVVSNSSIEEPKLKPSDLGSQVVEVSHVKYDSFSIDNISITKNSEKTELKDNVIADDVKLELDDKPLMVETSSSGVVLDHVKLQNVDTGPHENRLSDLEKDVCISENANLDKKDDGGDIASSEKLNLDRSSGDDSMEDDTLESRQIDSNFKPNDVDHGNEKTESLIKEESIMDTSVEIVSSEEKIENKHIIADLSSKRKLQDSEPSGKSEIMKRQRRWNNDGLKIPEPQSGSRSASSTPKDSFHSAVKRNFSRSDSMVSEESPKERVVLPSAKPATTSLRIDRFLRPFTLKAVQELLGKTGNVTSFWMDHIKTHCYVTYSSVEEAIATRNAVYNLQWPTNGGRLLVAEFVDPEEVKIKAEAPPQPPAAPVSTTNNLPPPPTAVQPPQPSPRLQVQRQQLPPPPQLPLPPPPPLSNPTLERERPLPPPPPLEKIEPPIVTLDDLFRKTRATPRIYYLPLSDEQAAEKLNALGRNSKQSAGVACRRELFVQTWLWMSRFVVGIRFTRGMFWFGALLSYCAFLDVTEKNASLLPFVFKLFCNVGGLWSHPCIFVDDISLVLFHSRTLEIFVCTDKKTVICISACSYL